MQVSKLSRSHKSKDTHITSPRNKESYFVMHRFSSHLRRYQSIDGASIGL